MNQIGKTIPSENRNYVNIKTQFHGAICFGSKGMGPSAKFDGVWKYDAYRDKWDRYQIECPHCGKEI